MSERRQVTFTLAQLRGLTSLELARAMATSGVPLGRYEELVRLQSRGAMLEAPPDDVLLAMTLTYALAWQYVVRDEPGLTWAEAQTWNVTMDYGPPEDATAAAVLEAEAELSVAAARLTGLPPAVAGELPLRELEAYGRAVERAGG